MVTSISRTLKGRVQRVMLVAVAAFAFTWLPCSPASASIELVKSFDETVGTREITPQGVAVNETTGDVYVADGNNNRVLRFDREGDFLEAWGWGVADQKEEFERCGPDGEPAHPVCDAFPGGRGTGPGELTGALSIAVAQATGDVYVMSNNETGVVQVFRPEGVYITGFGERGSSPTPGVEQIASSGSQDIAVDNAGTVYVLSEAFTPGGDVYIYGPRVMVFEPESPGHYEHYVYAGRSHDLFVGKYSNEAQHLAVDDHGDFYIGTNESLDKFDAANLTTPAWEVNLLPGEGLAVDPASGDAFYHAANNNTFRRLSSESGEEVESARAAKGEGDVAGMAYDPAFAWPGHPAGVLYAATLFNVENRRPAQILAFAEPPVFPPRVDGESVGSVGFSSATVEARIDPSGYDTRYRFQYGPEDCSTHACAEVPLGGAELGAGQEDLTASFVLSGLQSDTTYHYRVIASNQFGTVEGADASFATYPVSTAGLPDGRVFELVSPEFKNGGEVFPAESTTTDCSQCTAGENAAPGPMQSAPDGEAVVYEGFPFSETGAAINENEYLSKRTATGWQTTDLTPTIEEAGLNYKAFSTDLSVGVLPQEQVSLAPEAPEGYNNLDVREPDGSLRPLITVSPIDGHRSSLRFVGGSGDFSHLIFESEGVFTEATPFAPQPEYGANDATTKHNLYEWTDGQLRLVNVLPGNGVTHARAAFGSGEELASGTEGGPDYDHAISADGSRIFWTDGENKRVYVRENGESTFEIPDSGAFLTAAADGSKVLLDDGRIYDLETKALVDLTEGHGGFQGILGASEDLSRTYFVDTEVLSAEQNGQGATASAGEDNVYLYDSATGGSRYIATLASADGSSGFILGDWVAAASNRLAQVTPDGRYLVFNSVEPLTPNAKAGGEVFEYDASSGTLVCASCAPAGTPSGGGIGLIRPLKSIFPQPHNVLEDGRVFFDSGAPLSIYDTNGVQDVYEYEPEGVGTCTRSQGCVFLISGGQGDSSSEFMDASSDGSNVFFTTRDQLVREDQDDLSDLYDARIDGGFPALTQPACTGTGCQGIPNQPPIFATPSSVTFAGVGNYTTTGVKTVAKPKKKKPSKCGKPKRSKRRCGKASRARSRKTVGNAHRSASGANRRVK